MTEEKRKNRLLEVLEDSSSKSDKEMSKKSKRQSINSISAIFSPLPDEPSKNRLLLPKVRKPASNAMSTTKTDRFPKQQPKQEKQSLNTFSSVKLEPTSATIIKKKIDPFEQYYSRAIPRTGIEQPFLIDPPVHLRKTNDLERTNEVSTHLKMNILDEYRMRETGRIVNLAKTVYDVERDSPHYKNSNEYIEPSK